MEYEIEKGSIIGLLPDGDVQYFNSVSEYEDAYYDRMFEMNNCFEIEYPEDFEGVYV